MSAPRERPRLGRFATAGSLVSAIASSACCWLPLLLIGFGTSAVGVASFFEQYRPIFLVLATALLAAGFDFNDFCNGKCNPGSACATPRSGLERFNRIALWVATVFVVAFSFFPGYRGIVFGGASSAPLLPVADEGRTLHLAIAGMTCEGCADALTSALVAERAVVDADVSHENGEAVVRVDDEALLGIESLEAVVRNAGYRVLSVDGGDNRRAGGLRTVAGGALHRTDDVSSHRWIRCFQSRSMIRRNAIRNSRCRPNPGTPIMAGESTPNAL